MCTCNLSNITLIVHAQASVTVVCLSVCVYVCTVDSPNNGHFGTWASVLYSGSVLSWGVLVKHLPLGLNNTFDTLDSIVTHF